MNKREVETQKCVLYLWGENIFQTKEKSFCHWGHKFVAELLLLLLKKPLGWKWDLRTRNSHRDRTFSWWERVKIRDLSWKSLPDQKLFPIEISMAEMKSFSQECWFSPHQPLKWKSVLDKHSSIHPPLIQSSTSWNQNIIINHPCDMNSFDLSLLFVKHSSHTHHH